MRKIRGLGRFSSLARAACFSIGLFACSPQVLETVEGVAGQCACAPSSSGGTGGAAGAATTTGGSGTASGGGGAAGGMSDSLLHRYSFEGSDPAVAVDSVGASHGTIHGAQLDGKGSVVLSGGKGLQYVDLPNFLLKGLSSATFEAWVTWNGGPAWQRIFDFGEDTAGIDNEPALQPRRTQLGRSYIFCTPRGVSGVRVTVGKPGAVGPALQAAEPVQLDASSPLAIGEMQHVAIVVNAAIHKISLFIQGGFQGEADFNDSLQHIYDIDNWLGRSHFEAAGDEIFNGSLHEFRLYGAALDANQIVRNHLAGPNSLAMP